VEEHGRVESWSGIGSGIVGPGIGEDVLRGSMEYSSSSSVRIGSVVRVFMMSLMEGEFVNWVNATGAIGLWLSWISRKHTWYKL
jgi:hypothetical protein